MGPVRKGPQAIAFYGNQAAFMVTRKRAHSSHIGLMLIFSTGCQPNNINLLGENEMNLPHGFGDRPLATPRRPKSNETLEIDSCRDDVIVRVMSLCA